jgi:hypothetical protein
MEITVCNSLQSEQFLLVFGEIELKFCVELARFSGHVTFAYGLLDAMRKEPFPNLREQSRLE